MSERILAAVFICLSFIAITLIFIGMVNIHQEDSIRDLQRRVGQLEQQVRR